MKITCINKCYTQITIGVADYSKRQLKTVKVPHSKSTDLNRIQVTTVTCCNIHSALQPFSPWYAYYNFSTNLYTSQ